MPVLQISLGLWFMGKKKQLVLFWGVASEGSATALGKAVKVNIHYEGHF